MALAAIDLMQIASDDHKTDFASKLRDEQLELTRNRLDILQVNVGKLCNQACRHCHVDASPIRTEIMTRETIDHILSFLGTSDIQTVDITGGAPELIPDFRYFVEQIREQGRRVIVRCNLTVIFESGQEDLPEFYRKHEVELVCSLPCYLEENVDEQRGRGVFTKSIRALQILNEIGYGRQGTGLELHLVYNPVGASLPPPQAELEADYKVELKARYNIDFNRLYTITNMPISRFEEFLKRRGIYGSYMQTLQDNFNPHTIDNLMCRSLISVGWQGEVYDCDFNQMLDMYSYGREVKLWELTVEDLIGCDVRVRDHCFGCTAGAGSSCGGELL